MIRPGSEGREGRSVAKKEKGQGLQRSRTTSVACALSQKGQ